ncbi:uncharacterized protein LOC127264201 [Andrographis paniculata]|uniref:uncharacterized protein LOC127264201 n=1 Tax=Andrographis paniculata TaxID=175694 RepID=UPI0021E9530A|nr:uncharacterized protein LOC127264201 [Andrographis paniculata]
MDQITAVGYRHSRSPSGRFIGLFSPPSDAAISSSSSAGFAADELNEDEVFYTDGFSEPRRHHSSAVEHRPRHAFRQPDKFGILVALPESRRKPDAIIQKSAFPSSPPASETRDIPAIPRPQSHSQSMPIRRFQQSAPVNVPMMTRKPRNGGELAEVDLDDDDEILPPHEIVARGSFRNDKTTTFSVLEGAGRTLKGRDLRQVRNAVLRHTGFLD